MAINTHFIKIFNLYRRKLMLLWNRRRIWFHIRREGYFFTFVLHERYRKAVKKIKYLIVLIGILSGLIIFPNPIYALLFGLFLFLIQTLIEKVVYSYNVLAILPFPDFEIEPSKWLGVLSGYAVDPHDEHKRYLLLGLVFDDEVYAEKFYKYVLSLNYDGKRDIENNIIISIITNESQDKYVFYLYANPDRKTLKKFFDESEKERKTKLETFTDTQMQNYLMLTLGKTCLVNPKSYMKTLIKSYEDGIPYHLNFYYAKSKLDQEPGYASGTETIIKFNLKIRKESELTRKDFEYEMKRDWNLNDEEIPDIFK